MVASVQCIASYHSGAFIVGSALGSTITGGVTTVDIPATQAGDFILAFGSDQNPTPPVPNAGWTNVLSYNSPNNARVTPSGQSSDQRVSADTNFYRIW